MTLKEQILEDFKNARKAKTEKEKVLILSTFIGELDRISKTPTDGEVIKTIKKIIANNAIVNSMANFMEDELLAEYLPKMLTADEIKEKIAFCFVEENLMGKGMMAMGKIMKFLSKNYEGQYDGKLASDLIRQAIQDNE